MATETDLPLYLASTSDEANRIMEMVRGEDVLETVLGRMPVGGSGDPSEFDFLPRNESEISEEEARYAFADQDGPAWQTAQVGDGATVMRGDERPAAFDAPMAQQFPVFTTALDRFKEQERKGRVARIDTDDTYENFVCESALRELERRVGALEAELHTHEEDPFAHPHTHDGGKMHPALRTEVIGAAKAVQDISKAQSADEATAAMPQVPIDLPAFAQGKVKCWQDGKNVICSMRFQAADGSPRIATMAARPRVDAQSLAGAGIDPVTILGILPDLAAVATGKKLVKEVAGAALQAQRRLDVCGMEDDGEPLLLIAGADESASLAATMHTMQLAEAGDSQAQREIATLNEVSDRNTVIDLLLGEAAKRLEAGRAKKARATVLGALGGRLMQKYALAAGWV